MNAAQSIGTASESPFRAIATGAIVAGAIDAMFSVIVYVFVLRAFSIVGVLQYIASGLLGNTAFSGGLVTAGLGVCIHFFLAFAFAAAYWTLSRKIEALRTQAVPLGILYGALIWCFMDLVVLPLSGTPRADWNPAVFTAFLLDHALGVGLPIALAIQRYA